MKTNSEIKENEDEENHSNPEVTKDYLKPDQVIIRIRPIKGYEIV